MRNTDHKHKTMTVGRLGVASERILQGGFLNTACSGVLHLWQVSSTLYLPGTKAKSTANHRKQERPNYEAVTAAGDVRLPQVAASPRPPDLPLLIAWKTSDVLSERQTKNKWSYKLLEEKKPNRRRRKQVGSRNKGVRYADTKPLQLSKHPPVGDVMAEIWARWAGNESRNPGLTRESCRAFTSSRLGRESLMPSVACSCLPDCTVLLWYTKSLYCLLWFTNCWRLTL